MQPHYNTLHLQNEHNLNSRYRLVILYTMYLHWVNSLPDSLFKPYSLGRHQKYLIAFLS